MLIKKNDEVTESQHMSGLNWSIDSGEARAVLILLTGTVFYLCSLNDANDHRIVFIM